MSTHCCPKCRFVFSDPYRRPPSPRPSRLSDQEIEDSVERWLSMRVRPVAGARTLRADLYASFEEFCKALGEEYPRSTHFYRELDRRGYRAAKVRGNRHYEGLVV